MLHPELLFSRPPLEVRHHYGYLYWLKNINKKSSAPPLCQFGVGWSKILRTLLALKSSTPHPTQSPVYLSILFLYGADNKITNGNWNDLGANGMAFIKSCI